MEVDAVRKRVEVVTRDVPVLVRDFDPERKGGDSVVRFTSSTQADVLCFFDEYYLEHGVRRLFVNAQRCNGQ